LALAVPLSRFTPRVGGGSAFFVRRHWNIVKFMDEEAFQKQVADFELELGKLRIEHQRLKAPLEKEDLKFKRLLELHREKERLIKEIATMKEGKLP